MWRKLTLLRVKNVRTHGFNHKKVFHKEICENRFTHNLLQFNLFHTSAKELISCVNVTPIFAYKNITSFKDMILFLTSHFFLDPKIKIIVIETGYFWKIRIMIQIKIVSI